MDVALLVARACFGLGLAAHGAQKLFGWYGGYGIAGTGGHFERIGFRPGWLFAAAAGIGETAGGLLTALGLLTPVGPALMLSVMIVAALSVHAAHGFFAASNGVELALLYGIAALLLAFTGPGRYAIDHALGWQVGVQATWVVILVAVAGAAVSLMARRAPLATRTPA